MELRVMDGRHTRGSQPELPRRGVPQAFSQLIRACPLDVRTGNRHGQKIQALGFEAPLVTSRAPADGPLSLRALLVPTS